MLLSALGSPAHLLSVGFRAYVNSFARTVPVIPKAALKTLLQHIMWNGDEFGFGPGLGLLLYTFIGADREALKACIKSCSFTKNPNGGWVWGGGIKLEAWNWVLKSAPVP